MVLKVSMSSLYGLVLAGGQSSRMGRNKALLEWQEKPLFLAMADKLAAAGADPVLISGNSQITARQPGRTVTDRLPGRGPLSGIHAALSKIPNDDFLLTRLLVVPVDMPLLSTELLKYLADRSRQHQSPCHFQDFTLPFCLPVTTCLRERVERAIHSPDRKDYSILRLLRYLDSRAVPLPAQDQETLFINTNTPEEWHACQTFARSQSTKKHKNIHKEYSQQQRDLMAHKQVSEFIPLQIAVLTVSDTRTEDNDTSGHLLVDQLKSEGHLLAEKAIVKDDIYKIREVLSRWIAANTVQAVLITGGTGFSGRDSTPEAVLPLFDKEVDGYGELFRQLSYEQIGTSTIQSRTVAGFANGTVIFVMPGSNNACKTAWEGIIKEQLDSRHRPCNFVEHLKNVEPVKAVNQ